LLPLKLASVSIFPAVTESSAVRDAGEYSTLDKRFAAVCDDFQS
jgi:hypothetical protein